MINNNYGTVVHEGKEYILTSEADFTGRMLPHNNNYNDVEIGEEFDFEMSASAIDSEGKKYTVFWIFTDVKGESEKELDSFDYDNAHRVSEA